MWDVRLYWNKENAAGITGGYILGQLQNSRKKKAVKEEWHRPEGEKVELVFLYTATTNTLCSQKLSAHIHTHTMKTTSSTFHAPAFLKQIFIRITSFRHV